MNIQEIKQTNGFTLIELLVVVLIIGILAAVALPQYQKAVLRSRFAALKPLAKAVKNAQEIYYNEHGEYSTQLSALDVQAPSGAELELSDTADHAFIRATKTGLNNRYTMYFDHSSQFAGNVYCEALTSDTQALAVCEGEDGTGQIETNGEYTLYLLSGNGTGSFGPEPPQHTSGKNYWGEACYHMEIGCNTYTYSDGTKIETKEDNGTVEVYVTDATGNAIETWYQSGEMAKNEDPEHYFGTFCQKYSGIETVGAFSCSDFL